MKKMRKRMERMTIGMHADAPTSKYYRNSETAPLKPATSHGTFGGIFANHNRNIITNDINICWCATECRCGRTSIDPRITNPTATTMRRKLEHDFDFDATLITIFATDVTTHDIVKSASMPFLFYLIGGMNLEHFPSVVSVRSPTVYFWIKNELFGTIVGSCSS
jgi:hypothetical protein